MQMLYVLISEEFNISDICQQLTAVMQKDGISVLSLGHDGLVGIDDVFVGGFGVLAVVEEDGNVFFLKAVYIHD